MIIALVIGICFSTLGLFVLVSNDRKRKLADQALTWPVANGRVCQSRVHHARPGMDESDYLVFQYTYEVDGIGYVGKSIDLFELEARMTAFEMEELVQAYPPGAQVQVHYDERNPVSSVIEPQQRLAYGRNRNLGALLVSAGLAVLGWMAIA